MSHELKVTIGSGEDPHKDSFRMLGYYAGLPDRYAPEITVSTLPDTKGSNSCTCDWTKVLQVGCKCGAIIPYQGDCL